MKPIIGVMPLWDDEKQSLWMLPGYFDGLVQAGGLPIMFPLCVDRGDIARLAAQCDAFLLSGGHDVSPSIYHEAPLDGLITACEPRDALEWEVLRLALEADKPVLGVCRGLQFINAALGGTLYQDLPLQHPSRVDHHQTAPYDVPTHNVHLVEGSALRKCLGVEEIGVNSYHHQGIRALADGLEAMAVAPDGLVEAFRKTDARFLWAVQWHPEFSFRSDEHSRKILRAFVDAATPPQ